MPKVVNIRTAKFGTFVKVDRGTPHGNPFIMGRDGDRNRVCDLFEQYAQWRLTVQPNWLDDLEGEDIGCWCAPRRCHATTVLRLANDLD